MRTFDGWETRLYGDAMALPNGDELMHFRTKGSKNGVRRYQTESGEWTPLGLKERKAREGWGQGRKERKAAKLVARSERRAAKAEKKAAKISERKARVKALKEKKRLGDISKLTDEELQKKIARIKMEQEYKELTRNPLLKSGEKLVSSILEAREKRAERTEAKEKRILENNRIKSEIIKAKESTKRAKAETEKARQEYERMKEDRKAGLKTEREAQLTNAKIGWRKGTIHGGIQQRIHDIAEARGKGRAERIKERSFVSGVLRGKKRIDRYNRKLDPWEEKLSYEPDPWNRKKNGGQNQKDKKKG